MIKNTMEYPFTDTKTTAATAASYPAEPPLLPHPGDQVGIVCCSNGQSADEKAVLGRLSHTLERLGLRPIFSPYIYASNSVFSAPAKKRAQALMDFYLDKTISSIFDISGGDIANEILPYLDFTVLASHPKLFWGYSDLTTILNACYAKAGMPGVLYQVKNLVSAHADMQQEAFFKSIHKKTPSLFAFPYTFLQGTQMEGVVFGGNIRCLLKLAGTGCFPDPQDKLLFLEARSGHIAQMTTYFSQLKMMGVFDKIKGLLLGTFTQMERECIQLDMLSFVKNYAGSLPVAKTQAVGHGADSRALFIGTYQIFAC